MSLRPCVSVSPWPHVPPPRVPPPPIPVSPCLMSLSSRGPLRVPTGVPVSLPAAGDPQVGGQSPEEVVLANLEPQSVPALLVAHEGPVASCWVLVSSCPRRGHPGDVSPPPQHNRDTTLTCPTTGTLHPQGPHRCHRLMGDTSPLQLFPPPLGASPHLGDTSPHGCLQHPWVTPTHLGAPTSH